IVPPCGAISPARRLMSVVLPAPFGPMMAWNSPTGTSSVMASDAITPPKRLVSPAVCSSGSATAVASEQPFDAAVQENRDQELRRSEDQAGIFRDARQRFFQQQIGHRTDQR